jgi:hypothetical protein
MDLDVDAAAFVLVQSDASDAPSVISRCEAICKARAAKSVLCTEDADEGRQLLAARRMALSTRSSASPCPSAAPSPASMA